MDNLNELKAIWRTAKTDELPDPAEMLRRAKTFRNKKIRNKVLSIIVGVAGCIIMVTVFVTTPPLMISTRIGMGFTTLACGVLVYTNARSIKRFIRLDDYNNKEFIEFLEQTRHNQLYYYRYTQVVGMIFSSAGLLLYLYEFVCRNMVLTIVFYTISLAWVLFSWFYLRPRNFKKQHNKVNAMLAELKKIADQLDEPTNH